MNALIVTDFHRRFMLPKPKLENCGMCDGDGFIEHKRCPRCVGKGKMTPVAQQLAVELEELSQKLAEKRGGFIRGELVRLPKQLGLFTQGRIIGCCKTNQDLIEVQLLHEDGTPSVLTMRFDQWELSLAQREAE